MIDIIGLVLAHELGHLALGHKDYSSVSPREARRQEYAADNFAAALMIDSGRSILPGIMAGYARFAYAEALFETFDVATSTHPPGHCRVLNLLNTHIARDHPTREDQRNFEAGSGMSYDVLQQEIDQARGSCGF